MQDLIRLSEVGFTLTNPHVVSGVQVLLFWITTQFNDGGDIGTPSFIFSHDGEERVVTPQTVRATLQLPNHEFYTVLIGDDDMR